MRGFIPARAESCRGMDETEAEILTNRDRVLLEYGIEEASGCELQIRGTRGEQELQLAGKTGKMKVSLPCGKTVRKRSGYRN